MAHNPKLQDLINIAKQYKFKTIVPKTKAPGVYGPISNLAKPISDNEENATLTHQQTVEDLGKLPESPVYQTVNKRGQLMSCPLCASTMSKRKSKYGFFYGCDAWDSTKCPGKLNAKSRQPTRQTKKLMTTTSPGTIALTPDKSTPKISKPHMSDLAGRADSIDIE